jgi:hypothetical protein
LKRGIQDFHNRFVLTPADKASNNVIIVWRIHYINIQTEELNSTNAYTLTSSSESDIVTAHTLHITKFRISVAPKQDKVPTMYWLPKMHKTPYKARFIANSSSCTTTKLSVLLTSCLTAVKEHVIRYCEKVFETTGKNLFWSIKIQMTF